jgi:hypothetical protein
MGKFNLILGVEVNIDKENDRGCLIKRKRMGAGGGVEGREWCWDMQQLWH